MPEVSIIIPVYNRPQMLKRAVSSVLEQTFTDFELIVIDDGSMPPVHSSLEHLLDSRMKILAQPHAGVARARNMGISQARGQWVALLDSDDCWSPKKLELQLDYMQRHHEYSLAQCEEVWYRHGKRVNMKKQHVQASGEQFVRSLEMCVISSSSVILRRELYEEFGVYDEDMKVCEDYDFWLRVTSKYQVGLVPGPLVTKFGGHSDQLSHSEPCLDLYRIYALLKLMNSFMISTEQRELVKKTIVRKSLIVASGAEKRGLTERTERFRRVAQMVSLLTPGDVLLHELIIDLQLQVQNLWI